MKFAAVNRIPRDLRKTNQVAARPDFKRRLQGHHVRKKKSSHSVRRNKSSHFVRRKKSSHHAKKLMHHPVKKLQTLLSDNLALRKRAKKNVNLHNQSLS